jgi:hypothetical protein
MSIKKSTSNKTAARTEPAHSFLYAPSQLDKPQAFFETNSLHECVNLYLKDPLNERQSEAFIHSFDNRLTLLWGPPGTGKTTADAGIIMGWLEHAWSLEMPLSICVGSSNYNAIDNVLVEIADLLERRNEILGNYPETHLLRVRSSYRKPSQDPRLKDVERNSIAAKELAENLSSPSACYIIGGTWMQLGQMAQDNRQIPAADWFDLLLIDEASQVSVASAGAYYLLLKQWAHVVLAGDHRQLGPIYGFQMRDTNKGLFDCIFTYMEETHEVAKVGLDQNYRSNDEITGWPRDRFYTPGYQAFRPKRRLDIIIPDYEGEPPEDWPDQLPWSNEFLRLLDPAWPVAIVSYPPDMYTLSNPFEAQMVSALAYLYRRILKDNGKNPSDKKFWKKMLGIVTPHRAQMSSIKNLLVSSAGMPLDPPPFVDTVDRFQGQERELMIASYAVADRDFVTNEEEFIWFISDAIIQHLPSDADVARDAAHLQLFVENYCNSLTEKFYLPFFDNGVTRYMPCKLRVKTSN